MNVSGMEQTQFGNFAAQLRAAFEAGQDAFQTGNNWTVAVDRYEDEDLRRSFIAGWTEAENT